MGTEITIEIDDIHELMFKQLTEDAEDEVDLEAWAQDSVKSLIYQSHQNR